jgi:hypothetical protein
MEIIAWPVPFEFEGVPGRPEFCPSCGRRAAKRRTFLGHGFQDPCFFPLGHGSRLVSRGGATVKEVVKGKGGFVPPPRDGQSRGVEPTAFGNQSPSNAKKREELARSGGGSAWNYLATLPTSHRRCGRVHRLAIRPKSLSRGRGRIRIGDEDGDNYGFPIIGWPSAESKICSPDRCANCEDDWVGRRWESEWS